MVPVYAVNKKYFSDLPPIYFIFTVTREMRNHLEFIVVEGVPLGTVLGPMRYSLDIEMVSAFFFV